MNQSAIIAAAIFAGFGLFVASRDRLPLYARILWGEKPGSYASVPGGSEEEDDHFFGEFTPFGQIERALPKLDLPEFNWDLGE